MPLHISAELRIVNNAASFSIKIINHVIIIIIIIIIIIVVVVNVVIIIIIIIIIIIVTVVVVVNVVIIIIIVIINFISHYNEIWLFQVILTNRLFTPKA